jgi:16S rRNA processing protein RimM
LSDFFLIAKIVSAFGKKGAVKILSYSDFPERFLNLSKVYIDFFEDKKLFFVESVERHNDFFAVKFRNFNSAQDADFLSGKEIFVDTENLVKLPENNFFIHDLVGSKVFRNELEIGIVKEVLQYPANDVYVVRNGDEEILIPAVLEFIESFDAVNKILILKPGDDLYEDDEN